MWDGEKLILILTVICATAASPSSYWSAVSNSSSGSHNKISCAAQCAREAAQFFAVIGSDGQCSCDNCSTNGHKLLRQKPQSTLPSRSLLFLPFLENKIDNKGSESVLTHQYGAPMQFEETNCPFLSHGKKSIKMKGTTNSHLSYSLSTTLVTKAHSTGYIITMWLKMVKLFMSGPIFIFGNITGDHFSLWQEYFEGNVLKMKYADGEAGSVSVDLDWHHYAFIVRTEVKETEWRADGVHKLTANYSEDMILPGDDLKFGHKISDFASFGEFSIFCFTIQEIGNKTDTEVIEVIAEAKQACDRV